MAGIFINYRRADSAESAGRIYDRLVPVFGQQSVFKDVDNIQAGQNFVSQIQTLIQQAVLMLVLIGPQWDSITDGGARRIDAPDDYVRAEIETALSRGTPIIPVLVQDARTPPAKRFPSSIRPVAFLQSVPVRPDPDFHKDVDRLLAAIGNGLCPRSPSEESKIWRAVGFITDKRYVHTYREAFEWRYSIKFVDPRTGLPARTSVPERGSESLNIGDTVRIRINMGVWKPFRDWSWDS